MDGTQYIVLVAYGVEEKYQEQCGPKQLTISRDLIILIWTTA